MIIHHPKVIISPQKCPFFPQKPHLFNIFTLKNDLRTFVENCRESHLRDIMGQIAQDAWIRGWGGGVNLIQAMPEFWEHLDLPPLPKFALHLITQTIKQLGNKLVFTCEQ